MIEKDTVLYKALQMPARYIPLMVLLWILSIVGLIYLGVVV